MSDKNQLLDLYLKEYDKLKTEQAQRIGFRDNLRYVTLVLFATILSLALSNTGNTHALLIIPWICLILGWTSVTNDEKISAIGKYIRHQLIDNIQTQLGSTDPTALLGWEIAHRSDPHRRRRKIEQLIVDEITFVISGIIALAAFWFRVPQPHPAIIVLTILEALFLVALAIETYIYTDFAKGR